MRDSRPPMGKFWMERWVWAPQSEAGGMESDPMESDSRRVGREAMAVAEASSSLLSEDVDVGRMVERMPGVKVDGAKTCFMVDAVGRALSR